MSKEVSDDDREKAYDKLLEMAEEWYGDNIDVINIEVTLGRLRKVTAKGDVIEIVQDDLVRGINNLSAKIGSNLTQDDMTLAVLDFTNLDGAKSMLGKYVAEQLTTDLVMNSDAEMVERSLIFQLLREWDFSNRSLLYVLRVCCLLIGVRAFIRYIIGL